MYLHLFCILHMHIGIDRCIYMPTIYILYLTVKIILRVFATHYNEMFYRHVGHIFKHIGVCQYLIFSKINRIIHSQSITQYINVAHTIVYTEIIQLFQDSY